MVLDSRAFAQASEASHNAGWLNVTLTTYRNTDALDGVLGAVGNTLLCRRPFWRFWTSLPVSDSLETIIMIERSLFRAEYYQRIPLVLQQLNFGVAPVL